MRFAHRGGGGDVDEPKARTPPAGKCAAVADTQE